MFVLRIGLPEVNYEQIKTCSSDNIRTSPDQFWSGAVRPVISISMIALVELSFRILISVIQFSTGDFHIYIFTFSVRKERSINLVELDFLHFCQVK